MRSREVGAQLRRETHEAEVHPPTRRRQELPHDGSDHPIDEPRRKDGGPLANGLARTANTASRGGGIPAKKRNSGTLSHKTADLTPAKAKKQTSGHGASKPKAESTSAGVRQRPLASAERLIDRIDKALAESGIKGAALAHHLGIKPQGFTNMRRKPNSSMSLVLVADTAVFLGCDLYWLCTGRGGDYVPSSAASSAPPLSRLAREIAEWVDALPDEDHLRAWAVMAQIVDGYWPTFKDDAEPVRREKSRPGRAPTR